MNLRFVKNKPFLYKIRLAWILILCLLMAVFLYLKVSPFGHAVYVRDFSRLLHSGKGFIYSFSPTERVDIQNGRLPRLIGDPVYFSIFTPRTFSRAKITFKYRDVLGSSTPIISAGVLVDNVVWRYKLKPLANRLLDEWPADKILSAGSLKLYQRQSNYNSVADFLKDNSAGNIAGCGVNDNCLALFNYSLARDYKLPDYSSASSSFSSRQPWRGHYQAFVYVKNENFSVNFEFVDLNLDAKGDSLDINLYHDGELLLSRHLADDRPGSGQENIGELMFDAGHLEEGVYTLELKAGDDIITKKIDSASGRWVFDGHLWPVSGKGGLRLFTDADLIQLKALNPASLQDIIFDTRKFRLDETYKQFDFLATDKSSIKEVRLAKDDVIIESPGVFALAANDLFNPNQHQVDRYTARDEFAYILADYEAPLSSGEYKTASAEFNLVGAYRENGKYSFMISVPGLKEAESQANYLEIESIRVEFYGRTLWEKFKELTSRL